MLEEKEITIDEAYEHGYEFLMSDVASGVFKVQCYDEKKKMYKVVNISDSEDVIYVGRGSLVRLLFNLKIGNMKQEQKEEKMLTVKQWFEMVKDEMLRERLLRLLEYNNEQPSLASAIAYGFNWSETGYSIEYFHELEQKAFNGEIELIEDVPVEEESKLFSGLEDIKRFVLDEAIKIKDSGYSGNEFVLFVSKDVYEVLDDMIDCSTGEDIDLHKIALSGFVFEVKKLGSFFKGKIAVETGKGKDWKDKIDLPKEDVLAEICLAHERVNNGAGIIDQITDGYDYINPDHYQGMSKEVWEMMVDIWGVEAFIKHCEMTAFKYRMRVGKKPDQPVERDLEKAKWYEDKVKELKG